MKTFCMILLLMQLGISSLYGAKKSSRNQVSLKLMVEKTLSGFKVKGSADYLDLPNSKAICFLVPGKSSKIYEHYHPLSHLDNFLKGKSNKEKDKEPKFTLHHLSSKSKQATYNFIENSILKVDLNGQKSLSMEFESHLQEDGDLRIFDNFYPLQFGSCPSLAVTDSAQRERFVVQNFQIELDNSSPWNLLAPGGSYPIKSLSGEKKEADLTVEDDKSSYSRIDFFPNKQQINFSAARYVFALARNNTLNHYKTNVGKTKVFLAMKSTLDESLLKTVLGSLRSHTKLFGSFPFDDLTIVESSSMVRQEIPGMIVLNKPKQYVFQKLQESFLNWKHWIVSNLIASQWYGSAIKIKTTKDEWLLRGTCDFASLNFLQSDGIRYNLFNNFDHEFNLISLDYLQVQNMTASLLFKHNPLVALTNSNMESNSYSGKYLGLKYIKHAIALRHLRFSMGPTSLTRALTKFSQRNLNKVVAPIDLYDSLATDTEDPKQGNPSEASKYLKEWWTNPAWPDYSVLKLDKKMLPNGQWLAKASIKNSQKFMIPFQIRFKDKTGQYYLLTEKPLMESESDHLVSTITNDEPIDVQVDPHQHLFDSDRFNNRASNPNLNFFPLGSNTIEDDAYTSVWIPYFFRRPGEQTSIAIQAALFRYLQSGIVANMAFSPSESKIFYLLRYRRSFPYRQIAVEVSTNRTYDAQRTEKISLSKKLTESGSMSSNLILRHRQTMGQSESPHPTLGTGLVFGRTFIGEKLRIAAQIDIEQAIPNSKKSIFFTRPSARLEMTLSPRPQWAYIGRFFSGKLMNLSGYLPDSAKFKINDLDEMGIRIDRQGLEPLQDGYSIKQDLLIPLSLSFWKRSMILGKQLQLRIFHDLGGSYMKRSLDYSASGVGIILPLGGDVLGVGSLALSRFSVLAVLHSRKKSEISKRSQILFDLTGSL